MLEKKNSFTYRSMIMAKKKINIRRADGVVQGYHVGTDNITAPNLPNSNNPYKFENKDSVSDLDKSINSFTNRNSNDVTELKPETAAIEEQKDTNFGQNNMMPDFTPKNENFYQRVCPNLMLLREPPQKRNIILRTALEQDYHDYDSGKYDPYEPGNFRKALDKLISHSSKNKRWAVGNNIYEVEDYSPEKRWFLVRINGVPIEIDRGEDFNV